MSQVDESTGAVTTFATGLNDPFGIVIAPNGNMYVANQANTAPGGFGTISQITASGSVSTFAVVGSEPDGLVVNSAGDLFVVNFGSGTISEVPTSGTNAGVPATYATGLDEPTGIAFAPDGTLYVSEAVGPIYTVSTTGSLTLFATPGENPTGMTFDSESNLYVSGLSNGVIYTYSTSGIQGQFASGFSDPEGLLFDSSDDLVIADLGNGSGGGNASADITILDSNGDLVKNITGFTDPSYIVDGSLIEPTPVIDGTLTASGTQGFPFAYPIMASNYPSSYGETGLPAGLSVSGSGLISGTPTVSGTFTAGITASTLGGTGSANLTITLAPEPPPVIGGTLSATGTDGYPFSYQIMASNYPSSFSATGLPPGVTYSASTGLISGTPNTTGTFPGSISAINLGGTDSQTLTVTVLPAPPIVSSTLTASGAAGALFDYQIAASNNPTSFNATGLPPGLSVNSSSGLISGTPAIGGTFGVALSGSNGGGTGPASTLALTFTVNLGAAKGSYSGLAAIGGTDAGLFTLSLTSNGDFTAKLTLADTHYSLKGIFSPYGLFDHSLTVDGTTLELVLAIDPSTHAVSGTVSTVTASGTDSFSVESGLPGKFTASTLPAGLEGRYTAVLLEASGTDPSIPQAPGYGTMTVSSKGAVRIAGKLGDGTAFSTSGQLQTDGKTWTLFEPLYARTNRGSIAGTMTFEALADSDCDGTLEWIKPPQAGDAHYPGGFSATVDLVAAKYAPPPLSLTTGTFTLGGGDLVASAISDSFTVSSKEKVTVSGTNGVSLTLTPGTGAFSGHFLYPETNKKTPFNGVIYQKPPPPAGYGLFLGPSQSGEVDLTQ